MMPLTFGAGALAAVVLGSVLTCGPKVMVEGKSAPAGSAKQEKQGKDVEKLLYDLLRKDGMLRHPKMNFEIYVKRVVDRKLIDLEFKRRNKSGQYYDVVARAREGELRVHLPTRQLFVHMRKCYITSSDPEIAAGIVEDKVWVVDLPADLWK
jgi:hypothetical protein